MAGRIKQAGRFTMLLPRELDPSVAGAHMPLPPVKLATKLAPAPAKPLLEATKPLPEAPAKPLPEVATHQLPEAATHASHRVPTSTAVAREARERRRWPRYYWQ